MFPVVLLGEFLARLGEEVLGFAVFFREAVGLEVFFTVVSVASVCPARRAMVYWMLSPASWPVSCSKSLAFSISSLRVAASAAGTRLLRLRPSCQTWCLK